MNDRPGDDLPAIERNPLFHPEKSVLGIVGIAALGSVLVAPGEARRSAGHVWGQTLDVAVRAASAFAIRERSQGQTPAGSVPTDL